MKASRERISRRRLLVRAVGASSVVLLAACAPAAAPAPTSPPTAAPKPTTPAAPATAAPAKPVNTAPAAQAVQTVNFGGVVSMNFVPVFVGVERGIFLKNGVDLKVKLLGTGQEANQALQAGETQFTSSAPSNAPAAYEQGITFVNVVAIQNDATTARSDAPMSIHAHADAGIGAGEVAKLKGKRIGLGAGTTGELYLAAVLTKNGMTPRDVTVVNLPSSTWRSALESKQVDAVSSWEPFGSQLAQIPGAVKVLRGGGYLGYTIGFSPSTKYHAEQPDIVQRAVYGMAEASWYARKNRDEAAEIATRWLEGVDKSTAATSLEFLPYDPRLSKYVIQAWTDSMQELVDQKKLRAMIPSEKLFDTTFVDKAAKEYPDWFADLKPIV